MSTAIFSLKNKITIVTGGGSGIGKAISILFAKQGSDFHILDLDDNTSITVDEINAFQGRAFFHKCNVAEQAEIRTVVKSIIVKANTINILVNNAGIAHVGTIETTSEEDVVRLFNVNVKGCLLYTSDAADERSSVDLGG